jgi:hypothetical protein
MLKAEQDMLIGNRINVIMAEVLLWNLMFGIDVIVTD